MKKAMEWIKLDIDNLPDNEVLCANFRKGSYGYKEKLIGYVDYEDVIDALICDSEETRLEYATHYIDINKFDLL